MACACASPSACVLHPHGFTVTAWESPCFFAVALNSLHSRFAVSLSYLPLRRCCLGDALVLCRCLKWLGLVLRHQLTIFGVLALPSPLPLPLMLCRRIERLALALCCQRAFIGLTTLPSLLVLHACASLLRQIDRARA
jgi:hypothetical protein